MIKNFLYLTCEVKAGCKCVKPPCFVFVQLQAVTIITQVYRIDINTSRQKNYKCIHKKKKI